MTLGSAAANGSAGGNATLSSDAQWLEPTWLLGHSGDVVLDEILPSVPERYRLIVAYTFRWAWLVLELFILLYFERAKDLCLSQFAWCMEHVLVTLRFSVLHLLPIVISLLAAADDGGDGQWATFCRRALLVDSAVYTCLLLPLVCMRHARRLLLRTDELTILRVLKVVLTPLETLVVIYGTFGRGYEYNSNLNDKSFELEDIDEDEDCSPSSLMTGTEGSGALDEEDAPEHRVHFVALWLLWIMFILLGVVLVFQWVWSEEPPCISRCVAAGIFGMYAIGSLITACLALWSPDTLALAGYGFSNFQTLDDDADDFTLQGLGNAALDPVGAPRAKRLAAKRRLAKPRLRWEQRELPEEVAPWTASFGGTPLPGSTGSLPAAFPHRGSTMGSLGAAAGGAARPTSPPWTTGSLRATGSP